MATRSTIAMVNEDKTVSAIYCHFDGYIEGNGKTLYDHYRNSNKVKELISLGALSCLRPNIGTKHNFDNSPADECNFYGRDRGETDIKAKVFSSVDEYLTDGYGEEYDYLFENNEWYLINKTLYTYSEDIEEEYEYNFKKIPLEYLIKYETNELIEYLVKNEIDFDNITDEQLVLLKLTLG